MGFDSLPGGEQDDESFNGAKRDGGEVEHYRNEEAAKSVVRTGRLKDAWNRCSTWTIYGVWGVVAMLLVSFLGGLIVSPYLPEERVNTDLIFKILNWVLGAFKELFLVISAYFFGRKHSLVTKIVQAITPDE